MTAIPPVSGPTAAGPDTGGAAPAVRRGQGRPRPAPPRGRAVARLAAGRDGREDGPPW
jgi:hypothetical protein